MYGHAQVRGVGSYGGLHTPYDSPECISAYSRVFRVLCTYPRFLTTSHYGKSPHKASGVRLSAYDVGAMFPAPIGLKQGELLDLPLGRPTSALSLNSIYTRSVEFVLAPVVPTFSAAASVHVKPHGILVLGAPHGSSSVLGSIDVRC